MRISDWSSDVCSSDLKATNFLYYSREGDQPLDIYGFPGETGFVEQQRNAGDGTFAGVEGSVQSFFDFLPGVWKNFGVSLNASHILKARVEYPYPEEFPGAFDSPNTSKRSEERRVGEECVRTGKFRWWTIN